MQSRIAAVVMVASAASGFSICGFVRPAAAQLMLHGDGDAAPPPAAGGGAAPSAGLPPPKAKPIPMKTPSDDTLPGKDLLLNGARGAMAFAKQGKDLSLTKVVFDGESISKPGETCHVDIAEGLPLALEPQGRPEGLALFKAPLPACPFSFEVLEGAILVQPRDACEIKTPDCRVDVAGLWGPQGNTITPAKARDMEHARVRIETSMRADFRVLLSRAGKDKLQVKKVAAEQAGFSSQREVVCHSYALESQHGFCALEITRARVLALLARLDGVAQDDESPGKPAKKSAKPAAASALGTPAASKPANQKPAVPAASAQAPAATTRPASTPGPAFQGSASPPSDGFH